MTLGNQLDNVKLVEAETVDAFKSRYPDGDCLPSHEEILQYKERKAREQQPHRLQQNRRPYLRGGVGEGDRAEDDTFMLIRQIDSFFPSVCLTFCPVQNYRLSVRTTACQYFVTPRALFCSVLFCTDTFVL